MDAVEQILDKLMREVESSVHAFYRGDVRQNTQRIKTDTFRTAARQALTPLLGEGGAAAGVPEAASSGAPLAPDEIVAAQRCVMAWLPMGVPSDASPQARCIAAAREMAPSWGEREKARLALKRAAG
ncbi:MAG: hypothetical protein JWM41_3216 [Gemmatimonadetes bacterium]|nr:hypothetical protein [Gemmatimonadota bacterium]